jgi:hypothetical protein
MSSDDKKKINVIMILEIIGRPPEYLVETLNNMIKTIGQEPNVAVKRTKVNEPVEMKNQKDFYTSFAEIELDVEEISYLPILIFKYMPAHIEVVSPQNLSLSNNGWNDILNELTRRLHGYEEVVRMLQAEKTIMENQLRTIAELKKDGRDEKKEVKPERVKKKTVKKKV